MTLDSTIRSWNAGAEELYGYTAAEAIGQTMTLIVPPELHEEEAEMLRRAGRGEQLRTVRVGPDRQRRSPDPGLCDDLSRSSVRLAG